MTTATVIKIGPADHGRRMSLAEFEHAEVQEGHLYELGRGVIVVSDVPNLPHMRRMRALRDLLEDYRRLHREDVYVILPGSECKILLDDLESERHPDLSIYCSPPPGDIEGPDVWNEWIPEIVIEMVSPSSVLRDYEEKPEEYLRFGVKEYWLVDGERGELHVFRRRKGKWAERIYRAGDVYQTPLLPGFSLACDLVLGAAETEAEMPKRRRKKRRS